MTDTDSAKDQNPLPTHRPVVWLPVAHVVVLLLCNAGLSFSDGTRSGSKLLVGLTTGLSLPIVAVSAILGSAIVFVRWLRRDFGETPHLPGLLAWLVTFLFCCIFFP